MTAYYTMDYAAIDAALDANEPISVLDLAREVVRVLATDKHLNGRLVPLK